MGAYDKFRTDSSLENKGIVLDYTEFRVTIARAGGSNKAYQRKLEELSRPYLRAIQTDTMDKDKAEDLLKQAYAEVVILGWEVKGEDGYASGVELPSGEVVEASAENILKVLREPALGDLWADIRNQAQNASLYRASLAEARAGN